MVTSHYQMLFNTTAGNRRSLRIMHPNPDLDQPEIVNAVQQMLANDISDPARGRIESLARMDFVISERKNIL